MSQVAVLVPVLGRPHRVWPILNGFTSTAPAHVLFVADPSDEAELRALREANAPFIDPGGNYAEKIADGVAATTEPLVFTGADDLEPEPGWFESARAKIQGQVEAVGVNDLVQRPRRHATHFLLTRDYAETPTIDGQRGPFHSGYSHWFCDDELIATAKARRAYAYASDARVRHLHPGVGLAEDDDTYRRGSLRWREDRRLFRARRHLWG